MKILKKKNINEEAEVLVNKQTLDLDKDSLTPTVDHEVTAILLSKEHNEESAKENIEASGIEKVAKEVVDEIQDPKKDTPAPKTPSLKPYTEAKLVVDRKELGALIKESVKAGRSYKIRRSLKEGFRYVFEDFEAEYPECYFVCHSDEDANNENGYFDTLEDAKAYAEANPEICCIFKVCDNEEEKVWSRVEESKETTNECSKVKEAVNVCPECEKSPCECDSKKEMKEDVDARPNHTKLLGFIEEGILDYKTVAEALMSAASDDEIGEIIELYGWGDTLDEELKGNDAHNFSQYLYSEILELIRQFSDRGITEADLNKAIEFCNTHLKDDPRIPKSFFNNQANVESIDEPLEEAVVTPVSEPGDSLEDVKSSKGYQIECKFKDNSEWCDLDGCDGIDYEIDEASNGELSKYKKKNPTEYVFPTKEIADKFASIVRKYSEKYGITRVRVKENHDESLKEGLKKGQKSFLSMIKKYIDEHNAEDIEEADNIDEFLYNMYFNVLDANEIDIPYSVLKEFCEDPDNISSDEDENIFNFYIVSDELKEKVKKLLDQKFNSSDPEDIVENLSEAHEEGFIEEDPEIEIDNIETFEPTDEKAKSTMTTIKDAGEGAMFAFKDTLKDLFNLKMKVSDLQKLLSDSSEWLLDLLGFNGEHEEEIHSEEIPEEPVPVEEPEMVGGEFDEVAPVTDVSTININDFDEVEPVEYEEEEDTNFFVGD